MRSRLQGSPTKAPSARRSFDSVAGATYRCSVAYVLNGGLEGHLLRQDRTRIENAVRVERVFDPAGQSHDVVTEIGSEPGRLCAADSVFTGDGSTECDGKIHDGSERDLGTRRGIQIGPVV